MKKIERIEMLARLMCEHPYECEHCEDNWRECTDKRKAKLVYDAGYRQVKRHDTRKTSTK